MSSSGLASAMFSAPMGQALRQALLSQPAQLVGVMEGRPAKRMMYDADLKLWVEGHTVFSKGRFIGPTGKFVVWQEGADRYWRGKDDSQI